MLPGDFFVDDCCVPWYNLLGQDVLPGGPAGYGGKLEDNHRHNISDIGHGGTTYQTLRPLETAQERG
jgi:hypothetical protein